MSLFFFCHCDGGSRTGRARILFSKRSIIYVSTGRLPVYRRRFRVSLSFKIPLRSAAALFCSPAPRCPCLVYRLREGPAEPASPRDRLFINAYIRSDENDRDKIAGRRYSGRMKERGVLIRSACAGSSRRGVARSLAARRNFRQYPQ